MILAIPIRDINSLYHKRVLLKILRTINHQHQHMTINLMDDDKIHPIQTMTQATRSSSAIPEVELSPSRNPEEVGMIGVVTTLHKHGNDINKSRSFS